MSVNVLDANNSVKQKRKREETGEIEEKDDDETHMKLRKTTFDASEEEAKSTKKDMEEETNKDTSEREPEKLSYDDIKRVLFDKPTHEQTISCFNSLSYVFWENPPVVDVIKSGLLTKLVNALNDENEEVQYYSARALSKFVCGATEPATAAVEAGVIPPLVELVRSDNTRAVEEALWTLGNIADLSPQLSDCVIKSGGVDAMLQLMDRIDDMQMGHTEVLSFAACNICQHKKVDIGVRRRIVPWFCKLLRDEDGDGHLCACRALAHLTDSFYDEHMAFDLSGTVHSLISFVEVRDGRAMFALQTLSNIATGDCAAGSDYLTRKMLDLGMLQKLNKLLEIITATNVIAKEVCWFVSKIAMGSQIRIQQIIDAGFVEFIVDVLFWGSDESQINAFTALSQLAEGTTKQVYAIVEEGALPMMFKMLHKFKDEVVQYRVLETIHACLSTVSMNYPKQMCSVRASIEAVGGLRYLERMQLSEEVGTREHKMIRTVRILLEK